MLLGAVIGVDLPKDAADIAVAVECVEGVVLPVATLPQLWCGEGLRH